jgi:hypothetical protein
LERRASEEGHPKDVFNGVIKPWRLQTTAMGKGETAMHVLQEPAGLIVPVPAWVP